MTFATGTAWCALSNSCYNLPINCTGTFDCVNNTCVCPSGQTYCPTRLSCVTIPSCCATNDSCGNCLTFKTGTGWCQLLNACYNVPVDCPFKHDCLTGLCVCKQNQEWCNASKTCVDIPSCCLTTDGCGNCLTIPPNYVVFNGLCLVKEVIINCISYASNFQTCLQCQSGFTLSQNKTFCYSNFCDQWDAINNKCISCIVQYHLTDDSLACLPIIPSCISYDISTVASTSLVCLSCPFPYVLVGNQCTIPNCQKYTTTLSGIVLCDQCNGGNLTRSPDYKICYLQIEFCVQYSFTLPVGYKCTLCSFLHEPSANGLLCVQAMYSINGWSGNGPFTGTTSSSQLYLDSLDNSLHYNIPTLSSTLIKDSQFTAYSNSSFFTIKFVYAYVDPVIGNSEKDMFLSCDQASGKLVVVDAFKSDSVDPSLPDKSIRFTVLFPYSANPEIVAISCFDSSLYVDYGTSLSSSHKYFILN